MQTTAGLWSSGHHIRHTYIEFWHLQHVALTCSDWVSFIASVRYAVGEKINKCLGQGYRVCTFPQKLRKCFRLSIFWILTSKKQSKGEVFTKLQRLKTSTVSPKSKSPLRSCNTFYTLAMASWLLSLRQFVFQRTRAYYHGRPFQKVPKKELFPQREETWLRRTGLLISMLFNTNVVSKILSSLIHPCY